MKNAVLLLAVLLLCTTSWAQTVPDGLEWEIVDGISVTITRYTGKAATLSIPGQIQGLPVTAIGERAFDGCSSLTAITIPSSVTSIEGSAFFGCRSLASITIAASVAFIGDFAFVGCSSLESVTLSRGTRLGVGVFPNSTQMVYWD
jgi:hypothetical protein